MLPIALATHEYGWMADGHRTFEFCRIAVSQISPAVTVPVLNAAAGDVGSGPLHLRHDRADRIRFVPVVAVEQSDDFAVRERDTLVERIADTKIGLTDPERDTVLVLSQYIQGCIGGPAVDYDMLDAGQILAENA